MATRLYASLNDTGKMHLEGKNPETKTIKKPEGMISTRTNAVIKRDMTCGKDDKKRKRELTRQPIALQQNGYTTLIKTKIIRNRQKNCTNIPRNAERRGSGEIRKGGTTWVSIKDMKESYPVQVSEY